IVRVSLVGNTAMLALLTGINFSLLMLPSHWADEIPCIPDSTSAYAAAWNLHPNAEIEIIPPLGGFVGSDLLAGLIAVSFMESEPGSLFVDFGTNTEIALWDGKALIVTSAAGGPAFEGSGIQCGMPAEEGAIHSVEIEPETGKIKFKVLKDTRPSGICGSGVIDLVACMLREGKLTNTGSLEPGIARQGFILAEGPPVVAVKKHDIDLFQRAKGAVMAGIKVLLEASGMDDRGLKNIFVGGTFGSFLKVNNAQAIGLLPLISAERIRLSGNTALSGCELLMLFKESENTLNELRRRRVLINLANSQSFSEFYFESLYLKPVRV
ncbi:MAG: ASKHA domain-containing protein, partial [Geobacteraceae bacterium]